MLYQGFYRIHDLLFGKAAHFRDLARKFLQVDIERVSRMFDHDGQSFLSDPTLRPRQLRPIKPKLFAGPAHHAQVKGLTGAPKGDLGLSTLAMYLYDDVALAALLMFVPIEATSLLGQPFSKCCAFHCCAPVSAGPQPDVPRFSA